MTDYQQEQLVGGLRAIRDAVAKSREPDATLRKVSQLVTVIFGRAGIPEQGTEAFAEPDETTLVRVGNLQVNRAGEGLDVLIDGKPVDAKRVQLSIEQGKPAEASVTFLPESVTNDAEPGWEA